MIVATAGHVDHGKTLLLKALTGVDTDRLPEEKQRGLSIDLGFAYTDLGDGCSLGFVDVPGHEKFIRNMLAGVAGIDFALLVIAADDGPMPQTLEHLAILDLLGVSRGAVALSKIDKASPEQIDKVTREIEVLLKSSQLVNAPIYPVSGLSRLGVNNLRNHLETTSRKMTQKDAGGNFRLAIDRRFTVPGAGIIVTGSVFSGSTRVGNSLVLTPQGVDVRVRSIHAQNQPSETGSAGQRCALNITGADLDLAKISRGDWLVSGSAHAPTQRFDALLKVSANENHALKHWTSAHLHLGAASVTCRVVMLEDKSIAPGHSGLVQVVLDQPIGALCVDRFILRDQSAQRTIAGGTIVDPFSPARGRAIPNRIAWLHAMGQKATEDSLVQLLALSHRGLDLGRFAQAWNLTKEEIAVLLKSILIKIVHMDGTSWGFSIEHWDAYTQLLISTVTDWHSEFPETQGPQEYELGRRVTTKVPFAILRYAIREHIKACKLVRRGTIVHAPEHQAQPSADDLALWKRVSPLLQNTNLRPPLINDLATKFTMNVEELGKFLHRMSQLGWLIKATPTRYFTPAATLILAEMAENLAIQSECKTFKPGAYRDKSGVGRNLTIEILEFFDKAGLTQRTKSGRRILTPAKEIFAISEAITAKSIL